jgi:hypothetical protein
MPKYEVVEVIRRYWEVEADSVEQAYDDAIIGQAGVLVKEHSDTESIIEYGETTDYYKPGDMVNE